MVSQLFPIITSTDIERVLGFYRDLLGGTVAYEFPGPDGKPAYVGLDVGTSHLGIGSDPSATSEPSDRFALWAYVDDCDATVARLRDAGVTIVEEPTDQRWGERTADVRDPDGNLVHIASR